MGKKAVSVWVFSSLTFLATVHLIEAASVLIFNSPIRLLQLYPLIGKELQTMAPAQYFWISAASSLILWGITCTITFENPVETFLNRVLSDAKKQSTVETQLLEDKSEVLDAMYDTIESDNEILAQVKDLMCNVRADVKEIQPLKEGMEKMRTELAGLKKEVKKIQERTQPQNLCSTCGKPLLLEFKLCPYCGANIRMLPEQGVSLKDYR